MTTLTRTLGLLRRVEATLPARAARWLDLTDEQRSAYADHRSASEQWHRKHGAGAYQRWIETGDGPPTLRRDIASALFGAPSMTIRREDLPDAWAAACGRD